MKLARILVFTCMATASCYAGTIPLATGTAAWTATGGGATDAAPFATSGRISVTSNFFDTGTFLTGGSIANFDGFWTAAFVFTIPSNATNVLLSFANLNADDRVVLELNGAIIGNAGLGGPGAGLMQFTDGGSNDSFAFTSTTSGSANSGFNIGAANTLLAIVNNTGSGITATTKTFQDSSDGTDFGLTGSVTFLQTPEPWSILLMALGLAGLGARGRRKSQAINTV